MREKAQMTALVEDRGERPSDLKRGVAGGFRRSSSGCARVKECRSFEGDPMIA
jgi:hypothetical protein